VLLQSSVESFGGQNLKWTRATVVGRLLQPSLFQQILNGRD